MRIFMQGFVQDAVLHLYPGFDPLIDFEIFNHQDGSQEITVWNIDAPQPTKEELETAWLDARREHKRDEIAEAGRISLAGSGARNLDEAQIAAIGMTDEIVRYELSQQRRAALEAALDNLQAVRGRWNAILAKIDEAATRADLDAISWEMEL